eukprot:2095860-Amphidinium_carterae.2
MNTGKFWTLLWAFLGAFYEFGAQGTRTAFAKLLLFPARTSYLTRTTRPWDCTCHIILVETPEDSTKTSAN